MRRDESYQAREQKVSGEEGRKEISGGRQELSGGETSAIRRRDNIYQDGIQMLSEKKSRAIN